MEEQKININISRVGNLKNSAYIKCSSTKNIFKFNKLIYLDFDYKLSCRKRFNSIDKSIYNEIKNVDYNMNKFKDSKDNAKKCEVKLNNFNSNKIIDKVDNKPQLKIGNLPASTVANSNYNRKKISKQEKSLKLGILSNKTIDEIYSQNIDLSFMKEKPPKLPELFFHDYTFNDKLIVKTNETYSKLNQETIPTSFYNHLMISDENKKFAINRNKYFRTSATQRNKRKMLTVIYYSPQLL